MTNVNFNDLFKVVTYKELKEFTRNNSNRAIKSQHVKEFCDIAKNWDGSLKYGNNLVFGVQPIIINKVTGHILDGQHRCYGYFMAVENGYIPEDAPVLIAFEEIENEAEEKARIIDLNCKHLNWGAEDYYDAYAETNEHYARLKIFAEKEKNVLCYKMLKKPKKNKEGKDVYKAANYRYAAAILKGKNCNSMLKGEEFTVTDEEIVRGYVIHDELLAIRQKLALSSDSGIEGMAIEWIKNRDKINLDAFLKKSYISTDITKAEKKNAKNWRTVFGLMISYFPAAA